jgi:hypothetical protein
MNPLEMIMKWAFDNIFILAVVGILAFVLITYFKFGKKIKYKVIDREEVERMKFIESMKFNDSNKYKLLVRSDMTAMNGGNIQISHKRVVARINNYLEFEQTPIKLIEKDGKVTYELLKDELPLKLIGMVVKETALFGLISNPFKKEEAMLIEQGSAVKDDKGKCIIIPEELGFDRFMGFYYVINEATKPKIRNILDARILVQDFSIMASRYYAKSLEQCVYAPEVALQQAQKQTELQIELAKRGGTQKSI